MTILILHGIMGNSEENWFPWLKQQLTLQGHTVIVPNLPDTNHPSRQLWLDTVTSLLKNIDHSELIIIGHSLGVTTALDYLETCSQKIKLLVSVSGFHQDYGLELNSNFLSEKNIDLNTVKQNCTHFTVIYGDNDPYVPQTTLQALADGLDSPPIIIKKGGHLNTSAGYLKFPLLLDIINSHT